VKSSRVLSRAVLLILLSAGAWLRAGWLVAQTGSDSADTGTIKGTVIDSVTREPISRALVFSSDNRFATLTDSEGRFEFSMAKRNPEAGESSAANGEGSNGERSGLPVRPYLLMARKPGFLQDPFHPGQNIQDDTKEVTLALIPEAVITGAVTLPNTEPRDSVTLQLFRREVQDGIAHFVPAGLVQSTSDGQFRFADLWAGTYKLFTHELMDRDPLTTDPRGPLFGYPPVYYQNAPNFGSAATIEVAAGQTRTVSLSLVKQPYYRVKMPVVDADGTGDMFGVAVNVYAHGHKGPGFSLTYSNGERAITGWLPNGTYTVEATRYGQNGAGGTGIQTITVKGAAAEGASVTLAPNAGIPVLVKEEFTSPDHTGRTTWNIEGHGVEIKGPRRYLNISLEPVDDVRIGRGGSLRNPTKADDPLVIAAASAGSYWVRVNSSRGYPASVRSGDLDLLHQPLQVGVGGAAPIEITMRDDWAEISGKVEGVATGTEDAASDQARRAAGTAAQAGFTFYQPIFSGGAKPSAHVYCIPLQDSSGQFTQMWVGPDGSFDMANLAPGAYQVLAFDREQPQLEYRNPEAMRAYAGKGPLVRVSAGQKERVTLQVVATEPSAER
jgi:hypothetical protein